MSPVLCSLLLACHAQSVPAPAPRPNVVLVIGDDIAVADMARVSTPNLDSLAAGGAQFTRAYANPTCSATRRTILFGNWHGTESGSVCASPTPRTPSHGVLSFPGLMRDAGYRTALFGKWHVGANRVGPWETAPQSHGFDTWRAGLAMNVKQCGSNSYSDWIRADDGVSRHSSEYNTIAIRDAFIEWWTNTPGPRFAVVAYQAAHTPFNRPPACILPRDYSPVETTRGQFETVVASLDFVIGEMLATVDLDDTWFIFVGDNGTPRTAAPIPARAKATTFERGIHVPLYLAHSALAPVRSAALVHTVDLMATVAEIAGITIATTLDSRSFAPCLTVPEFEPRGWVFCAAEQYDDRCIRTARFKLRIAQGVEELYDLQTDPHESSPLDLFESRYRTIRDEHLELLESLGR